MPGPRLIHPFPFLQNVCINMYILLVWEPTLRSEQRRRERHRHVHLYKIMFVFIGSYVYTCTILHAHACVQKCSVKESTCATYQVSQIIVCNLCCKRIVWCQIRTQSPSRDGGPSTLTLEGVDAKGSVLGIEIPASGASCESQPLFWRLRGRSGDVMSSPSSAQSAPRLLPAPG